jgi:hypothetical protein
MKATSKKLNLKKFGKKALIVYICWCIIKGLLFLLGGWLLIN